MDIEIVVPLVLSSITLVGMAALGYSRGPLLLGPKGDPSPQDSDTSTAKESRVAISTPSVPQEPTYLLPHLGKVTGAPVPEIKEHGWFKGGPGNSSLSSLLFALFYTPNPFVKRLNALDANHIDDEIKKNKAKMEALKESLKQHNKKVKEINEGIKLKGDERTNKIASGNPVVKEEEMLDKLSDERLKHEAAANNIPKALGELEKRLKDMEKNKEKYKSILTMFKDYVERFQQRDLDIDCSPMQEKMFPDDVGLIDHDPHEMFTMIANCDINNRTTMSQFEKWQRIPDFIVKQFSKPMRETINMTLSVDGSRDFTERFLMYAVYRNKFKGAFKPPRSLRIDQKGSAVPLKAIISRSPTIPQIYYALVKKGDRWLIYNYTANPYFLYTPCANEDDDSCTYEKIITMSAVSKSSVAFLYFDDP
jgi:hypothetical protein